MTLLIWLEQQVPLTHMTLPHDFATHGRVETERAEPTCFSAESLSSPASSALDTASETPGQCPASSSPPPPLSLPPWLSHHQATGKDA